jgi:hypothetical protein
MGRDKGEATMGSSHTYSSYVRFCVALVCILSIAGCSLPKIKSSLMTGMATSTAVGVASALVPGALAPAVIGGTTAVIASAMTAERSVSGEPISVTADTVVHEAPANFFTLLQRLVEMGGWLLILVILVPMILGWILPGPLERKKKS